MIPYKKLAVLIYCSLLLAGCWDNIEVEERGFVTGIAIDLANSESSNPSTSNQQSGQNQQQSNSQNQQGQNQQQQQQQQQPNSNDQQGQNQQPPNSNNQQAESQNETPLKRDERVLNHQKDEDIELNENNKYKLTQQLINPSSLGSHQSMGSSTSSSSSFRNLSQAGDTIIEMNRDMVKQAGRRINVTHLKVVLFSEAIAKEENVFADLMDIFLREKEMMRSVKIVITQDQAGNYLNILPENEKLPSRYISKVLENHSNLDIAEPLTVGNVQSYLLSKNSFVIPFINQVNDTTVNYEGLSVYSAAKKKVVGNLAGDEAKGLNFIQSKNQSGTINLKIDNHDVTFEILEINSKISLKDKNKSPLPFEIKIDVEAGIAEQYGSLDIMKEKNYKKLQKALEKEIKRLTDHSVSILQNDFQTDVIGLNKYLYQHDYPFWESIKDNWEKGQHNFSKSKIQIIVNATIEKPGNIIKSH